MTLRASVGERMDHTPTIDVTRPAPSAGQAAPKRRQWGMTVAKALVSAALIVWLLRDANLRDIGLSLQSANGWLVLLAFSLHLFGLTLSALRWRTLLRAQGADASIGFLLQSYLVAMFFNNFLPSTIGGDTVRAYDSWRLGQSKMGAVAVVFVDRFLGLFALMLFALLALLLPSPLTQGLPLLEVWVVLGVVGMLVLLGGIFAPPAFALSLLQRSTLPFAGKLAQVMGAFDAFSGRRDVLAKALVLSVLLQANVVFHYFLIARALALPVPLFAFFLIVPLTIVLMMLPVSINAIGIRESAFAFFFAAFGVATAQAVAFAWIALGTVLLQGLLGGIVYVVRR